MFKPVLDVLDKVEKNGLSERIDNHPVSKKYWMAFGGSIVLLFASVAVNIVTLIKRQNIRPAPLNTVTVKNSQLDVNSVKRVPLTLPTAHHSFKNVTSWIKDAIGETYTFDFLNFDKQVRSAEKYFTPEGYATYVDELRRKGIEEKVKNNRLEVSIVPLQTPVMINSGTFGDAEFWRFRVPVLVSVQAGSQPVLENYMMELLILRVPAYENHRGLSIAEYNMKKL